MLSKQLFRSLKASKVATARSYAATLDGFGDHLFKGAVAAPYLLKQGFHFISFIYNLFIARIILGNL